MRNRLVIGFSLAATLLATGPTHALLFRAYLASNGSDANQCTLAQPCRLLPAAIAAVASGGEIWMLDSANYNSGTVTIGKSVSIRAVPGSVGSIVATGGGPAISITTGGLDVALRNVAIGPIAGGSDGTNGVEMTGASNLTIEDSVIAGVPGNAIYIVGTGSLRLAGTTLRKNGQYTVWLQDGARGVITATRMLDNTYNVIAYGHSAGTTTVATISDSVMSRGYYGAYAYVDVAATARISVARCTIERTVFPIGSDAPFGGTTELNVGSSQIVDNSNAWLQSGAGGTLLSLGNNQMSGNGAPIGSKTSLAPQ